MDTRSDEYLHVFHGHTDHVRNVQYLNNTQIVSCSEDKSIKIWNNDRTKNDASILPEFLKQYGNIIYRKHQLDF